MFPFVGCKTVEKKTKNITEIENQKMTELMGKSAEEIKIELGVPINEMYSDDGMRIYIYKKKKLGITCERRIEFDESDKMIGYFIRGCF